VGGLQTQLIQSLPSLPTSEGIIRSTSTAVHQGFPTLTLTTDPDCNVWFMTVIKWATVDFYTVGLVINTVLLLRALAPDMPVTRPGTVILD
jgi:hypothetical protein